VSIFQRNMLSPASGLKWQGWEFKEWRLSERKPVRDMEYGKRMWTKRELSSRLLGEGQLQSGVREETTLFKAHQRPSCSYLEPVSIPLGRKWEAFMTYSGRSHPLCWCCWDGAQSLLLPWWLGPSISNSWPEYCFCAVWYDGPDLCNVYPWQTSQDARDGWSRSFSHIASLWLAPFLLAFIPQILRTSSPSQPCHFSPEDGDSMFLWNVVIDVQNQTMPNPKTTPVLYWHLWEPHIPSNYLFLTKNSVPWTSL
jgi:hypothetical protein